MRLILASRSPRRAELLSQIGLHFDVLAVDVDESPLPDESAQDYVVRLAHAKAEAAYRSAVEAGSPVGATERSSARRSQSERTTSRSRMPGEEFETGRSLPPAVLVLGADTAVVLDGRILGKPADHEQAVAMLLSLSGRIHQVTTGVAVHGPGGRQSCCAVTEVRFRVIERWEAEAYGRTGEGSDKAGGYGVQGIGGIFAETIRGSYSAVVGLPLAETERLLRDSGLDTWHERMHA